MLMLSTQAEVACVPLLEIPGHVKVEAGAGDIQQNTNFGSNNLKGKPNWKACVNGSEQGRRTRIVSSRFF
jgi:hypothetical protein